MLRTWQFAVAIVLEPLGLRVATAHDLIGRVNRPFPGILFTQQKRTHTAIDYDSTTTTGPYSSELKTKNLDLMVNTLRGSTGLFYTILPVRTGRFAFRLRFHGDTFTKRGMFCCLGDGSQDDSHLRLRGAVNVGFSITPWLEAFAAFHSQANRNERVAVDREDPPTTFALGDVDFGTKLAHQFRNSGVGIGTQLALGLLSGTTSTSRSQIKFSADGLLSVDLRPLTRKSTPIRFSSNIGWILDNSHKLVHWTRFRDPVSREVLRFSTGADHNRIRTRWAIDFPMRLGTKKSIGIDPSLEYSWNISTQEIDVFKGTTATNGPSISPRSQGWLTLGLRTNIYAGLHLDFAVDVGTSSPSYEFGAPVPAWQINFGLAWSFDPSIAYSHRPASTQAMPPPPVKSNFPRRVHGIILDRNGDPIPEAKITVLNAQLMQPLNAILSDKNGAFVLSPLNSDHVSLHIELKDRRKMDRPLKLECTAPSCETAKPIRIQFRDPPPLTPIEGQFLDENEKPIILSIELIGKQIHRELNTDENGRFTTDVPAGVYTVRSRHPQFVPSSTSIDVGHRPLTFGATLVRKPPSDDTIAKIQANAKRIYLPRPISYRGNIVDPRHTDTLDALAGFLVEHPEYERIEIQVHTHDRGDPKQRSQSRADSIREYLVNHGVNPGRLTAIGQGDKHPVAVNITSRDRLQNDRTLLIVRSYRETSP